MNTEDRRQKETTDMTVLSDIAPATKEWPRSNYSLTSCAQLQLRFVHNRRTPMFHHERRPDKDPGLIRSRRVVPNTPTCNANTRHNERSHTVHTQIQYYPNFATLTILDDWLCGPPQTGELSLPWHGNLSRTNYCHNSAINQFDNTSLIALDRLST